MTIPAKALAATLAAAAMLFGTGCGVGGDSPEEQVAQTASELLEAGAERDFETFCSLLTADARGTIESGGAGCEETLAAEAGEPQEDAEIAVSDVRVSGNRAAADVRVRIGDRGMPAERTLELEQDGDGEEWLVADFGD